VLSPSRHGVLVDDGGDGDGARGRGAGVGAEVVVVVEWSRRE
jgi:hypothetical protein